MWKSAGRASSVRVLPWHLPYKWGKTRKNLSHGIFERHFRKIRRCGSTKCSKTLVCQLRFWIFNAVIYRYPRDLEIKIAGAWSSLYVSFPHASCKAKVNNSFVYKTGAWHTNIQLTRLFRWPSLVTGHWSHIPGTRHRDGKQSHLRTVVTSGPWR
jgi:hypothetical protein